jgi:hypothetical protein
LQKWVHAKEENYMCFPELIEYLDFLKMLYDFFYKAVDNEELMHTEDWSLSFGHHLVIFRFSFH